MAAVPPSMPPAGYPSYPPPIQPAPQTSGKAVVALVLVILAWTSCGPFLSIPAIIVAGQARREIEQSGGWVTGDGLANASRILGWVNVAIYGALMLAFGAFMLFAVILGATAEMSEVEPFETPGFESEFDGEF